MFRSVVRSAVRRIAPLAMAATALATPLASSPTVNTAATLGSSGTTFTNSGTLLVGATVQINSTFDNRIIQLAWKFTW